MNQAAGGIGGFVGREPAAAVGARLFPQALRFSTGRAALARALKRIGATRLFVPDWICDSVLDAARFAGCEPVSYPLGRDLMPRDPPRPGRGEALLVLDPFGFAGDRLPDIVARAPKRTIVDLTQAMYAQPIAGAWSFASARKFVGVADGAFLWGPDPGPPPPLSPARDIRHLEARAAGLADAHARHQAYESALVVDEYGPSAESDRVLDSLDHDRLRRIRVANFVTLHRALRDSNRVLFPAPLPPALAPLAYPYLPRRGGASHRRLAGHRIWVPHLWPERRNDPSVRRWVRVLAEHLLPLPIDHRYGRREMEFIIDRVRETFG